MSVKSKFPIEIWRGSFVVRIYRQKSAAVFTVAYYEDGQRKRESFGDRAEAREEADKVADRLSRHNGSSLSLRGNDLIEYTAAQEYLHQLHVRVDIAASEYSQAVSILNGRGTLVEAVRHFIPSRAGEIIPIRTHVLVNDLIKAREANHASKRHIQDLERAKQ